MEVLSCANFRLPFILYPILMMNSNSGTTLATVRTAKPLAERAATIMNRAILAGARNDRNPTYCNHIIRIRRDLYVGAIY
jgi:hypothetical protein